MTKSKVFLILSLSFIGGVFSASFFYPKIWNALYLHGSLVGALILGAVFYQNKKVVVFSFALIFLTFGIYLTSFKLEKIKKLNLGGEQFSGEVRISKEPEKKDKYQKIIVSVSEPQKKFKILINSYDGVEYAFGDILRVDCLLRIPQNQPKGESSFDYQMYLAKDGIFYECQKPKLEKVGENEGNLFLMGVFRLKNSFQEKIERSIPAPEAGLATGLLLGGDDALSAKWQEKFSLTGMTHIVAVSGYNVAIIAEYLMLGGIFLGLWRKQSFWFAVSGIVLFVTMIGLPSSAVRAGVMGILLLWAVKNGRLANSQNAIIFSAMIMLAINPLLLRYDIGFQLSFLATLGIIYIYPVLEKKIIQKNKATGILEILFLTLAAQIFVLPVILYNFQKLSLISPLANILILPIVPLAMLLVFLVVVASFIFVPLAMIFSWLAYLSLKYETMVIDFLSRMKYSAIEFHLSFRGVFIWYIILVGVIYLPACLKKKAFLKK